MLSFLVSGWNQSSLLVDLFTPNVIVFFGQALSSALSIAFPAEFLTPSSEVAGGHTLPF
jgi:hypothetical protein